MTKEERSLLRQSKLDQARDLYLEGTPICNIAGILGISEQGIIDNLKQHGLMKPKKRWDRKTIEDIVVRTFLEGSTPGDIAYNHNIFLPFVQRVLREKGFLTNKYPYGGKIFNSPGEVDSYRSELKKKIISLQKEGILIDDIASQCQLSLKSVKFYLSRSKNKRYGR